MVALAEVVFLAQIKLHRNHVLHITAPESAASRFLLPSRPVYYQSISVDLTEPVPAPAQHQTTDAELL